MQTRGALSGPINLWYVCTCVRYNRILHWTRHARQDEDVESKKLIMRKSTVFIVIQDFFQGERRGEREKKVIFMGEGLL